MKVQSVMTARSLKHCSPETKLHNAAKLMQTGNCGALPVVDKNKKVVGIVTDRDIALALAKKQPKSRAMINVSQIMSENVHTVNTSDEIETALREMRTNKIGRLPVVDKKGKLKGILSMHNLLAHSLNGETEFGSTTETGESIAKTIMAITERYSLNSLPKRKTVSAGGSESLEEVL